jgi:DNA polymerase-3 subunit delta'
MTLPPPEQATEWLTRQGVGDAAVLLAATGGQPQLALEWRQQGVDAALWARLPALVMQGEAAALAGWPLPRVIDALQKLCHDTACVAAGAAPRYFPATSIAPGADGVELSAWERELDRVARHDEHPWSAGLMIDSLVLQGRRALTGSARTGPANRSDSVHSRT